MGFGVQVAVMDRCLQKDPTARPTAEQVTWPSNIIKSTDCRTFLFTHLNGNVSTEMVLNRFDLHLIIFDPSLRSQSFQRWPASHVVSCVLRCPKSLMKPPDMLSLVETPRDHPTQTPKRSKKTCNGHEEPIISCKKSILNLPNSGLQGHLACCKRSIIDWLLMNSPSGAVFEVETARQTCLVFNCTAKQSKEIVWKAFRLNWGMNFEAKKYKALGILKKFS